MLQCLALLPLPLFHEHFSLYCLPPGLLFHGLRICIGYSLSRCYRIFRNHERGTSLSDLLNSKTMRCRSLSHVAQRWLPLVLALRGLEVALVHLNWLVLELSDLEPGCSNVVNYLLFSLVHSLSGLMDVDVVKTKRSGGCGSTVNLIETRLRLLRWLRNNWWEMSSWDLPILLLQQPNLSV